jgi:tetratricopeptide (TPR) repeat protein
MKAPERADTERGRKARATVLLVCFLFVTAATFAALKRATDRVLRRKVPGSSIIYIPSGKFLRFATFGYSALAADLVYLWAIQYYSTPTIDDRFDHLAHIFTITSELDPRYIDPYEIGAIIAVQEAGDVDAAFKILDTGAEKNPDQWIFPFNAGHIAMMTLKDFALAEKYFETCMRIPGAPDFVARLRANAIFRKGDLETSWETWREIYNTAPDDRTRKIASNHLYNVKATIDTGRIRDAVRTYRERRGRLPDTLARLVREGILEEIPKDLDGQDYLYDPETGEVKTAVIPWRR